MFCSVLFCSVTLRETDAGLAHLYIAYREVSSECRKVFGFALATSHDWLKKLAPLFHPIRRKIEPSCNYFALVFPRFASVTLNFDWFTGLSVSFVIG